MTALGATPEAVAEVVVRQPDYLTAFAAAWSGEDLEDWKNWARWRLIHARASCSTDDLVAEDFAFYGRRLSRAPRRSATAGSAPVSVVESLMGDAVGKLYVERHFPPDAKARMDELVANLREAYRVSINDLEWMTPADPREGAGQAGQVHPEDRLSGQVAGLLDAGHRARRPVRQLPSRAGGQQAFFCCWSRRAAGRVRDWTLTML